MTTVSPPPLDPKAKKINKLTIDILDPEKVIEAYPGVEVTITVKKVDRKKLRPIVNALFAVGVQVPGVNAYYASDEAVAEKPTAEEPNAPKKSAAS